MKKILLIFPLLVGGFLSAQGNGDYVNMTFVKTTPGEDYEVNPKRKVERVSSNES